MANSLSAEVWLDQRRWDALEEALKAQGSDIEQHLQDYLISLYNEMVPQEQWEQVEKRISNERQRGRPRSTRSIPSFMFGSMAMTVSSQRVMAKNFWM